jgi:hypothetical protein
LVCHLTRRRLRFTLPTPLIRSSHFRGKCFAPVVVRLPLKPGEVSGVSPVSCLLSHPPYDEYGNPSTDEGMSASAAAPLPLAREVAIPPPPPGPPATSESPADPFARLSFQPASQAHICEWTCVSSMLGTAQSHLEPGTRHSGRTTRAGSRCPRTKSLLGRSCRSADLTQ